MKDAALEAGVTTRTMRRMKAKVRAGGARALAHAARGKPGNRRIDGEERKKMEKLLVEKYADFKPTFAAEKLSEIHGIIHDPKTARSMMIALGLWEADPKARAVHRHWRERRAKKGSLIQYDGSYHPWLEDRWTDPAGSHELCLLLAVDDATGRLMDMIFAPHEGVLPTLGFWREYALSHGLPGSIYIDRFSTYKMHMKLAAENPDTETQFQRVMRSLGVILIFALSPQAKGRVERMFETLQDRLVKELRLQGISTPEEANTFMRGTFMKKFNEKFSVPAREDGNLHRRLTEKERKTIDVIFAREDVRTVQNDFTVSHNAIWYQLLLTPRLAMRPKDKVVVRTTPEGAISLWIRGKEVRTKVIAKERRRPLPKSQVLEKRTFLIPAKADISISR